MRVRSFELNAQLIKDIFHAVMPIVLMYVLPQSWITLGIVYAYVILKGYVYTFLKDPNEMSVVAMFGILLNAIFIVGYIDAL